jgi:hypothetical protein
LRLTAGLLCAFSVAAFLVILVVLLVVLSSATNYYEQRAAGFGLAMYLVGGIGSVTVLTTVATVAVNLGQALGPTGRRRRPLLLTLAAAQSVPLAAGLVLLGALGSRTPEGPVLPLAGAVLVAAGVTLLVLAGRPGPTGGGVAS